MKKITSSKIDYSYEVETWNCDLFWQFVFKHVADTRSHLQKDLHRHRWSDPLYKKLQAYKEMPQAMLPPPASLSAPRDLLIPLLSSIHHQTPKYIIMRNKSKYHLNIKVEISSKQRGNFNLTSTRGVAMTVGATALALMPSLAHSHAKLLASWFIAPIYVYTY